MEDSTIETGAGSVNTASQTSAEEQKQTSSEAVQPQSQPHKDYEALQAKMNSEIATLKAELQKSNIKSALAERRLVPLDSDLVSKLIVDKISTGMEPDQACASLYQSHPYLFKNSTSAQVSVADKAEDAKVQKDLNDRLINSVVERLRRDTIKI